MSEPTRLKRNYHPGGDQHWTRQSGVQRERWAKLRPAQITTLCARYAAGETPSNLSRAYRIGRSTVYRYLRERGLIGLSVPSVSRRTEDGD